VVTAGTAGFCHSVGDSILFFALNGGLFLLALFGGIYFIRLHSWVVTAGKNFNHLLA